MVSARRMRKMRRADRRARTLNAKRATTEGGSARRSSRRMEEPQPGHRGEWRAAIPRARCRRRPVFGRPDHVRRVLDVVLEMGVVSEAFLGLCVFVDALLPRFLLSDLGSPRVS